MNRPITTLFMLESLDGKISIGNSDNLDLTKLLECNKLEDSYIQLKYKVIEK